MVGLLCKGYLSKILWIINLLAKIRNISWCFCLLLFAVEFCASNLIIRETLKKNKTKRLKVTISWLMRKVHWQGMLIDKESSVTRKFKWWGKSIDEKSWLVRKVYWWEKLINFGFDERPTNTHMHKQTNRQVH